MQKLKWRMQFLADPEAWFRRQPAYERLAASPFRDAFAADLAHLSLRDRVAYVARSNRGRRDLVDELLLRRLRRAPDGSPYFDIDGTRLYFHPNDPVADEDALIRGTLIILREAFIDPAYFFTEHVSLAAGDTVLDLGGNIGTSALLFSRLVGPTGRVHSFEPVYCRALARNVRENGADNVRVVPEGVADRSGTLEFDLTSLGIDSRIAGPGSIGARKLLPITTVDDYVEREGIDRVDFIKMDIEGAEELALRGAERVIRRSRPKLTIASYHTDPRHEKQHPKLVRLLGEMGYHVEEVEARHIYAW